MQLDLIECEIQMINAHQIKANLSFDVSGIRIWDLIQKSQKKTDRKSHRTNAEIANLLKLGIRFIVYRTIEYLGEKNKRL